MATLLAPACLLRVGCTWSWAGWSLAVTLEMVSVLLWPWAPDQQPMLPLTRASCLPRLSFHAQEPEPQGPAPDLEIQQAELSGE